MTLDHDDLSVAMYSWLNQHKLSSCIEVFKKLGLIFMKQINNFKLAVRMQLLYVCIPCLYLCQAGYNVVPHNYVSYYSFLVIYKTTQKVFE